MDCDWFDETPTTDCRRDPWPDLQPAVSGMVRLPTVMGAVARSDPRRGVAGPATASVKLVAWMSTVPVVLVFATATSV